MVFSPDVASMTCLTELIVIPLPLSECISSLVYRGIITKLKKSAKTSTYQTDAKIMQVAKWCNFSMLALAGGYVSTDDG